MYSHYHFQCHYNRMTNKFNDMLRKLRKKYGQSTRMRNKAFSQNGSTLKRWSRYLFCGLTISFALKLVAADQPWKHGDASKWTAQEVERILMDSPWAEMSPVTFGLADEGPPPPPTLEVPQAGMPSPKNAATDGRWDGGVGRVKHNGPPTLNVDVRWDSALPVRQALARKGAGGDAYSPEQVRKDYIISIFGLVPGGRYGPASLNNQSGDGAVDVRNPEEMLESLMRYARLYPKGKNGIRPIDAKLDNASGTLHLFFPRSEAITLRDKEVTLEVRFGSLSVLKKFKLKDMVFNGQLEL
jgi:hypothetical protein